MHACRCQWIKFNNITICFKQTPSKRSIKGIHLPQNEFTGRSTGCKQKWLVNRWWWWWWWWLHFCGVLTLWMPRTFIYILKDTSRYRGGIGTSSLYHSFISSSCSVFSSMVIWKGLRRNNVNHWPDCFLRKLLIVLKVTSQVDAVLWSIERSSHDSSDYLPRPLTLYCEYLLFLRQELQQNRSFKALKFLNCRKDIFMKKPIWLPVASVCLGWHSRG